MHPLSQALRGGLAAAIVTLAAAAPVAAGIAHAASPPRVVASIPPVGSLVAAVMKGVGEPTVLLPAGASPHAYSLRPSDARALAAADAVFWIGEALEAFLEEPLDTLARPDAAIELMETEGLTLLPTRSGGIWAEQDHDHGTPGEHADAARAGHEEEHHDHGAVDAHLWLDPRNAAVLVDRIAAVLADCDPAHATAYRANAANARAAIDALDRELAAILAPIHARRYVVFHDAYQYLEHRYGLSPIGAVTVGPERAPGARRLAHLRDEIAERGASCAFREPQFTPRILDSLAADTRVKVGVLDPLGADVPAGPDGYAALMRRLAGSLADCLSASR